jgi:Pilus formation protein N terminal region
MLAVIAAAFAGPQLHSAAAAPAVAATQTITVELDRAKLVRLPKGARSIVQGQPLIARITPLLDGPTAVLTGIGFGETNMVVLDAKGMVQMDAIIRVTPASDAGVVVQRGIERTTYFDCERRCSPRMQLGDTSQEAKDADQILSHEQAAQAPAKTDPTAGAAPQL